MADYAYGDDAEKEGANRGALSGFVACDGRLEDDRPRTVGDAWP